MSEVNYNDLQAIAVAVSVYRECSHYLPPNVRDRIETGIGAALSKALGV